MMKRLPIALCAAALLAPVAALAHPGHTVEQGGLAYGLMHPLTGLDHLLAMLAVGLWAALAGGRALWALPVAFIGALLAGFGLGAAGLPVPAVEPMILASVVVIGGLVALAVRLPLIAAVALVVVFGLAHGHAHGTEGPATDLALHVAGFTLATAGLHAAGLGLGIALAQSGREAVTCALGGAAALAGVGMTFL